MRKRAPWLNCSAPRLARLPAASTCACTSWTASGRPLGGIPRGSAFPGELRIPEGSRESEGLGGPKGARKCRGIPRISREPGIPREPGTPRSLGSKRPKRARVAQRQDTEPDSGEIPQTHKKPIQYNLRLRRSAFGLRCGSPGLAIPPWPPSRQRWRQKWGGARGQCQGVGGARAQGPGCTPRAWRGALGQQQQQERSKGEGQTAALLVTWGPMVTGARPGQCRYAVKKLRNACSQHLTVIFGLRS